VISTITSIREKWKKGPKIFLLTKGTLPYEGGEQEKRSSAFRETLRILLKREKQENRKSREIEKKAPKE